MAFVNERLTTEEKEAFKAREIPNPGNPFIPMNPLYRTIDREADVFLVWALQEREEPHDTHFILSWKGRAIPVKLRDTWVSGSPRLWELLALKLTGDLEEHRPAIVQHLKEALTVYGFNGSPVEPFHAMNQSTVIQCNF